MDSRTRQNKILKFIEDNPRCTKTEVTVDMEKKGISSPATTNKILEYLETDRKKIIVKPDELNHRKHRLTINDKSEFYLLRDKIRKLEERINKLTKALSWRLYQEKKFKNSKSFRSLKQDYLNLLHFAQLTSYSEVTSIAKTINKNIRSRDDQETLYLRLTEVLNVSDKLNEMLAPEIELEIEKLLDKMKNEQNPLMGLVMAKLSNEIVSLFTSEG